MDTDSHFTLASGDFAPRPYTGDFFLGSIGGRLPPDSWQSSGLTPYLLTNQLTNSTPFRKFLIHPCKPLHCKKL